MNNSESTVVNWNLLLDSQKPISNLIRNWAVGESSTRQVSSGLSHSEFSGEFRRLVRNHGTTSGRKLARRALRRRGVNI